MRRILMVLCLASVAVGVGAPAKAGAGVPSCANPARIGSAAVGMAMDRNGTVTLCIRQDANTAYEVSGGALTYTYGTEVLWAAGGSFCWFEGSDYTCASAGNVGGAGVWATPDVATLFLMPTACTTHSANPWDRCFAVMAAAGVDGPVGSTTGAGASVLVCEAAGGWFTCPLPVGAYEDLRNERQMVYNLVKPFAN